MKTFLTIVTLLAIFELWYFSCVSPLPETRIMYINLPEEIQAASPGDSMVLYQQDSVYYLYYYHKVQGAVIPKGGHLVIVQ